MNENDLCIVVPAAGRGTRLGVDCPKVFVPLAGSLTLWSVLAAKLRAIGGKLVLVLSEDGEEFVRTMSPRPASLAAVDIAVQKEPRGTGDAVFAASASWRHQEHLLVVWGDQVHVSVGTLQKALQTQRSAGKRRITIPLAWMKEPYVEYVRSADGKKLEAVRMRRENDAISPAGWADVGTFFLSTDGLVPAWEQFVARSSPGAVTRELNFLPFLAFLSEQGWETRFVEVEDAEECRGINDRADLAHFQKRYRKGELG